MIVIDYVDGRARTERITDSSTMGSSSGGSASSLGIDLGEGGQPNPQQQQLLQQQQQQQQQQQRRHAHHRHHHHHHHHHRHHQREVGGPYVDAAGDGGASSPPPPPPHPPPRLPNQLYHGHGLHQQQGHAVLRHHHHHHHHHHQQQQQQLPHHHHHTYESVVVGAGGALVAGGLVVGGVGGNGGHLQPQKRVAMRNSHSSDSSSAYSGSETMQSSSVPSSVSVDDGADEVEVDLSGLLESVVDSDEEDGEEDDDDEGEGEDSSCMIVRDAVRECLEKDPSDRTQEDIDTLLEFTQHLTAFTNMTLSVRRALVATMVFAVVEKAGTVVMTDGEELDSWSVIINGHVEIEHSTTGSREELHLGDSFGITPTMEKLYHRGVMRTKCDDCQFVCVTQTDYYRILHQGEENQRRHEEDGRGVVLVTELRVLETGAAPSGDDGGLHDDRDKKVSSSSLAGPGARKGHVVIRGAPDKLMAHLMEDNSSSDPTFIEDFLLTYRTFFDSPMRVADQLLDWFRDPQLRDKVTRVLLLWVNNHFTDFETDPAMIEFLERFEGCLEREKMHGQLRMLNFACAAKARRRVVTLTRPSREEPLQFSVVGGYERGCGIFISRVEKGSKAEEIGLKRGDQILEVNGQSFEHVIKHSRATEILKGVCHLSITVKSNLLAFQEMLQSSTSSSSAEKQQLGGARGCVRAALGGSALVGRHSTASTTSSAPSLSLLAASSSSVRSAAGCSSAIASPTSSRDTTPKGGDLRHLTPDPNHSVSSGLPLALVVPSSGKTSSSSASGMTMPPQPKTSRINRAFNRFLHKPKSLVSVDSLDGDPGPGGGVFFIQPSHHYQQQQQLHGDHRLKEGSGGVDPSGSHGSAAPLSSSSSSLSNPDLLRVDGIWPVAGGGSRDCRTFGFGGEYPEHVLKVYKADQTFKYLLVHKETTAHEVVMLSLQEFGITAESSSNFSLCEVSVSEGGFVKQRTLPDPLQNLAERIGLASRYYIKNKNSSESLLPDDAVGDLLKEACVSLLQLNPVEVATQLMVEDFTIFRQIEATEYVDELFELKSGYGTPSLTLFGELVNREMMWAISEVVSEHNVAKRVRVVKQLIKVARQCKDTQNFNSMFAIVSGLGHAAVSRLKSTWERLPSKYQRLFGDMQQLMDPSRNMSRYRNLVNGEDVQPPIIPFYPIVKKDLTFIHLANNTVVEGLINFEKLRMIAKEIRALTNMCSAPLDLFSMLELGGQQPSNAMVAMNQLATGGQYLKATVSRRRKKPSGVPNPKRMFEEAQMVRRVKAYLKNMKVITNEERLHQMSLECEPPAGGVVASVAAAAAPSGSGGTQQTANRKRNSSPTPSALSSTSSASHTSNNNNNNNATLTAEQVGKKAASDPAAQPTTAKFGAASPQAVKKLLALSEQIKTRPKSVVHQYHHHHHGSSSAASPMNLRREGGGFGGSAPGGSSSTSSFHHHHQSISSSSSVSPVGGGGGGGNDAVAMPVDLTAESSSVSALRKVSGGGTDNNSLVGVYDRHPNHHHHHHHHKGGDQGGPSSGANFAFASVKEQRRHQQQQQQFLLSQQQRHHLHHHAPSVGLGRCPQPQSNVSLHHAVPVEVRCASSSASSSTASKASSSSSSSSRVVISPPPRNPQHKMPPPPPPPPSSSSSMAKSVSAYYVHNEPGPAGNQVDQDDEDETQVSAV